MRKTECRLELSDFEVLRQVLLTMDRIQPVDCTEELFLQLSRAAEHRLQLISTFAISALLALSQTQPGVADWLIKLASNRTVKTRLRVVQWLNRQLPCARAVELLNSRLDDRSSQVRIFAAQQSGSLRLEDMIPTLCDRLKVEEHPKVLRTLKVSIGYLTDGYHLSERAPGKWSLWVRLDMGTSLAGGWDTRPSENEIRYAVRRARDNGNEFHQKLAESSRSTKPINSYMGNVFAARMELPFSMSDHFAEKL